MVLFDRGQLTQNSLMPHEPDLAAYRGCCDLAERVVAYPQTVPLFEALLAKLEGQFNWDALKAIFPLFFISLFLSTFQAARAFVPPVPALGACVLLGLAPAVSSGLMLGGYADMPQAALFAGFLAALFHEGEVHVPSFRRATPWLLGGVLLVKSEGAILFYIGCATILTVWASKGFRELTAYLRRYAGAIAVVIVCGVLRGAYLAWMDTKDTTYGPIDKLHLTRALQRLWTVPQVCAHICSIKATGARFGRSSSWPPRL